AYVGFMTPLGDPLEGIPPDTVTRTVLGGSVSHRMFTPQDLSATERVPGDLSYSGQLVVNVSLVTHATDAFKAWSLHLGGVGPWTGAESMQRRVHRWIDSEAPQGWAHQAENEFLLALGHQMGTRLTRVGSEAWSGDSLVRVSGMVGNLATY